MEGEMVIKIKHTEKVRNKIEEYDTILIGIGNEWKCEYHPDIVTVYDELLEQIRYKNFFLVTTVTDAVIYQSGFGENGGMLSPARQLVAPCGNVTWQQCPSACTKDIWEPGEAAGGLCPHCGAPLTGNTIAAETYIEEGYLPQWNRYMQWLGNTIGRPMLVLELGTDLSTPTVIRFPFEKTVLLNEKSEMIRISEKHSQIPAELSGRGQSFAMNSVEFIKNIRRED